MYFLIKRKGYGHVKASYTPEQAKQRRHQERRLCDPQSVY